MTSVADRLAALLTRCLRAPLPFRLRAWDGSEAGPGGAPVVVLRCRLALRRLLRQPGEVGLAEAATARVWRLYLVGSSLAVAERRMGVDQILAVRPTPTGDAGMSGTPHGWYGRDGSR
ncbi:hypothetical protein [Streptomyces sp. NPDC006274]|uniref:hypothetical protein n=1 Tax=unclassified Streptomyces TaxID=2593676 RepID=UPI00339EC96C